MGRRGVVTWSMKSIMVSPSWTSPNLPVREGKEATGQAAPASLSRDVSVEEHPFCHLGDRLSCPLQSLSSSAHRCLPSVDVCHDPHVPDPRKLLVLRCR